MSNVTFILGSDSKVIVDIIPTFKLEIVCFGRKLHRSDNHMRYKLYCIMNHYISGVLRPLISLTFHIDYLYPPYVDDLLCSHLHINGNLLKQTQILDKFIEDVLDDNKSNLILEIDQDYIEWNIIDNIYNIYRYTWDNWHNHRDPEITNPKPTSLSLCDDAKDQFMKEIKQLSNNLKNIIADDSFITYLSYDDWNKLTG